MKRLATLRLLLLAILTAALLPRSAAARWSITPRLYAEGQYDDNLFLSDDDMTDDFITTVSPGIDLAHQSPTDEVVLDYQYTRSFFQDSPELDYSGHLGHLEARKDFGRLRLALSEAFVRSENPVELTGLVTFERPSIRRGERFRYTRNIVRPELRFRFGEGRSITLRYRNNLLRNDAEDVADQDGNAYGAALSFQINAPNQVEVVYDRFDRNYGGTTPPIASRSHDEDVALFRYTHSLNPRTALLAEYRYDRVAFDRESEGFPDYTVHDPRLGFSHRFTETTFLIVTAGYALRNETRNEGESPSGRADLSGSYKRLEVEAYGEGGFDADFVGAELLGFYEFWRAGLHPALQVLEKLWAEGYFYIERDDFEDIDRRDTILSGRASLTCQVLPWLFVSLDYQRIERSSNIDTQEFEDNRYLARITAQKDLFENVPEPGWRPGRPPWKTRL
ncbi:MAG: outer membrane beta-barrel protein [bacterium]